MKRSEYLKGYYRRNPWAKTFNRILTRCRNENHRYYKKGIKCFLNTADLKFLWFRDKAYNLKKSSIDRKNANGHYTLKNCRFIELAENQREGGLARVLKYRKEVRQLSLSGKLVNIFHSNMDAQRHTGVANQSICWAALGKLHSAGGYRWEYA